MLSCASRYANMSASKNATFEDGRSELVKLNNNRIDDDGEDRDELFIVHPTIQTIVDTLPPLARRIPEEDSAFV